MWNNVIVTWLMWTMNAFHIWSAQDKRTSSSIEVEVQGKGLGTS